MNSSRARAGGRAPAGFPVALQCATREYRSQARNISVEGMYLETQDEPPPAGASVELRFTLDGIDWDIPAAVAHGIGAGIGVHFLRPQRELFRALAARPQRRTRHIGAHLPLDRPE